MTCNFLFDYSWKCYGQVCGQKSSFCLLHQKDGIENWRSRRPPKIWFFKGTSGVFERKTSYSVINAQLLAFYFVQFPNQKHLLIVKFRRLFNSFCNVRGTDHKISKLEWLHTALWPLLFRFSSAALGTFCKFSVYTINKCSPNWLPEEHCFLPRRNHEGTDPTSIWG